VILGLDGVSDFNALHSGRQNGGVDGDDLRDLPLSMHKTLAISMMTTVARLLAQKEALLARPEEQPGDSERSSDRGDFGEDRHRLEFAG
jgi:hypothetical protein